MIEANCFETFLTNIRPTERMRDDMIRGHEILRQRLNSDESLKPLIVTTFLQGSYRRATAIRPIDDRRSDVDVVVVTNLSEAEYTPAEAMGVFKPFLKKHYLDKWCTQGRSFGIELSYVTMDMVVTSAPSEVDEAILVSESVRTRDSIEQDPDWRLHSRWLSRDSRYGSEARSKMAAANAGPEWKAQPVRIQNREANRWESTHPLEQISWTRDKNHVTSGHYINVVKAIKWWRIEMHPRPKHPKGFPLERLVGECCPDSISSVAQGVVETLETIVSKYRNVAEEGTTPILPDYGVPNHDVFARISADDFREFYYQAVDGAALARRAYHSTDPTESRKLWRELFGRKFPLNLDSATSSQRPRPPTTIPQPGRTPTASRRFA